MTRAHRAADRRVLVAGSRAKEQILLGGSGREPEVTPCVPMGTANPGTAAPLAHHQSGPGRHFVLLERTLAMADTSRSDPDRRPFETLRVV